VSDLVDERPPPTILRRERALLELAAQLIGEQVAVAVFSPAPSQSPTFSQPYQSLVEAPNGTGTVAAVYTVGGTSAAWPLSVMCRLTTDATVADRTVAVEYIGGTGLRYVVAGTQAIVKASGQQSFCWHPQAGSVAWPIEDVAIAPLPQQHILPFGQIAVRVWNGAAGDVLDQVVISLRYDPFVTEILSGEPL